MGEQVAAGAVVANAQVGEHNTTTAEAVKLAIAVIREARRQGLCLQVETHRATATETPEKFDAIVCARELRRVWHELENPSSS